MIGTIASLEILSTDDSGKEIRRIFDDAIHSGSLNWLSVAPEGFEFYEIKGKTVVRITLTFSYLSGIILNIFHQLLGIWLRLIFMIAQSLFR